MSQETKLQAPVCTTIAALVMFAGQVSPGIFENDITAIRISPELLNQQKGDTCFPKDYDFTKATNLYEYNNQEKVTLLSKFVNSFLENQEEIPQEFNKEIDDNFWQLF